MALHPAPCTLHPTPYTLHPTPYTPHPTPYTKHQAPSTKHQAPYTLSPHPTALTFTLQPSPLTQASHLGLLEAMTNELVYVAPYRSARRCYLIHLPSLLPHVGLRLCCQLGPMLRATYHLLDAEVDTACAGLRAAAKQQPTGAQAAGGPGGPGRPGAAAPTGRIDNDGSGLGGVSAALDLLSCLLSHAWPRAAAHAPQVAQHAIAAHLRTALAMPMPRSGTVEATASRTAAGSRQQAAAGASEAAGATSTAGPATTTNESTAGAWSSDVTSGDTDAGSWPVLDKVVALLELLKAAGGHDVCEVALRTLRAKGEAVGGHFGLAASALCSADQSPAAN